MFEIEKSEKHDSFFERLVSNREDMQISNETEPRCSNE